MDLMQTIVLAILQGLTEFLPISSSGHLILVPTFLGWEDQGLAFDIAVHLGTLLAVMVYFATDIAAMVRGVFVRGNPDGRLAWQIVVASIPLGIAGLIFADFIEAHLRSAMVIASTTALFGILLWWADIKGARTRNEKSMLWTVAIGIGCAQMLALIPGTSRSGITMTVALMLGLNREAAGRFSFLLAIPAILMAASWQCLQLYRTEQSVDWQVLIIGAATAAIVAFTTIALFLKVIGRIGMSWFAGYRLLLAAVIVYVSI